MVGLSVFLYGRLALSAMETKLKYSHPHPCVLVPFYAQHLPAWPAASCCGPWPTLAAIYVLATASSGISPQELVT